MNMPTRFPGQVSSSNDFSIFAALFNPRPRIVPFVKAKMQRRKLVVLLPLVIVTEIYVTR